MKKTVLILLIVVLAGNYSALAQGPFVGAVVDKNGNVTYKGGWSLLSIVEIAGNYAPKSSKQAGFMGGSLKAPIKFSVLKDNYMSKYFWGVFLNYTGGMIQFPSAPNSLAPVSVLKKYGGATSLSVEISWIGSGLAMAIPFEIGYGKLNFNQDFPSQYDAAQNKYELKSNLFLSSGLKFYFSKNHCKAATEGLKIGY